MHAVFEPRIGGGGAIIWGRVPTRVSIRVHIRPHRPGAHSPLLEAQSHGRSNSAQWLVRWRQSLQFRPQKAHRYVHIRGQYIDLNSVFCLSFQHSIRFVMYVHACWKMRFLVRSFLSLNFLALFGLVWFSLSSTFLAFLWSVFFYLFRNVFEWKLFLILHARLA